jgi:hypothetical protein
MATKNSKQLLEEEENKVNLPADNAYWEELVEFTAPKYGKDTPDVFISVGDDRNWLIKAGETVKIPRCAKATYDESVRMQNKAFEYEEKLNNAIK